MKTFFVLLVSLFFFQLSFSCGNEYGYRLDGKRIHTRYFYLSKSMMSFDTANIEKRILELVEKLKKNKHDYESWSDLSLNLMKLGNSDSALKILIPLVKEHPEEYNLIANLGTCYELQGELDSALKYISLGLEINPKSHFESEWIHQKILEAKIKEKKYPGWLNQNEIIKTQDLIKHSDTASHNKFYITRFNRHFFYQIRTRVPFTPAPNKVISNLLVTLGDFNTNSGTYENALLAYVYALKFENDFYMKTKINNKIKKLNQKRDQQVNISELPIAFKRMMKRSKIDPEILLLGLDDFAITLDSLHLDELQKNDSLMILKQEIEAIKELNHESIVLKDIELNKSQKLKNIFLLISILLAFGILTLIFIQRNKS